MARLTQDLLGLRCHYSGSDNGWWEGGGRLPFEHVHSYFQLEFQQKRLACEEGGGFIITLMKWILRMTPPVGFRNAVLFVDFPSLPRAPNLSPRFLPMPRGEYHISERSLYVVMCWARP